MNPFFLESRRGQILCVHFSPPEGVEIKGAIVLVPPFAEELNRSRHVLAQSGRDFSGEGYHVLLPDLFGTGDSDGNFVEAEWDDWVSDLRLAGDWIRNQTGFCPRICALRLGFMLALDCIDREPENWGDLIAWQPVLDGEKFIRHFLRISLAAQMMTRDEHAEAISASALLKQMAPGKPLEIAGYQISASLISAIMQFSPPKCKPDNARRNWWFDIVSHPDQDIPPAREKSIAGLRKLDWKIQTIKVVGKPFWQLEEPVSASSLLMATCQVLGK